MAKLSATEIPIYKLATTMSTVLIATHGLERAYEISTRVHEQILSHVKRQIEKHPAEWSDRIKREINGLLPIPPVPGTTSTE